MDLQSYSVGNYRLGYGLSLGILKQNKIICCFINWNVLDLRETLTCSNTACSNTWIWAFESMARFILWALTVNSTFWLAVRRWSDVFIFTWTDSYSTRFMTTTIWSAWCWATNINNGFFSDWFVTLELTWNKWISYVSFTANTSWHMIYCRAIGINSTYSWAWVYTFITNAWLVSWTIAAQNLFIFTMMLNF